MMCPGGMGGWGMAGMAAMTITTLLVIAAIIVGIVFLVRYLDRSTPQSRSGGGETAERLLAERYARGEIDDQEYQQRLNVLRGGPRA